MTYFFNQIYLCTYMHFLFNEIMLWWVRKWVCNISAISWRDQHTTQWPKENVQKDKQRSTKYTYKTKDRVTWTPLKTGGELRCSGRVESLLRKLNCNEIMLIMLFLYWSNMLCRIIIVLTYWNNSPQVDMSLHPDTLTWFRTNQYLPLHLNTAC